MGWPQGHFIAGLSQQRWAKSQPVLSPVSVFVFHIKIQGNQLTSNMRRNLQTIQKKNTNKIFLESLGVPLPRDVDLAVIFSRIPLYENS
jgi:hypothetical protein